MTLPSFLGIGGERCGSTWLHNLLDQHPYIYVPERRKELKFFSSYYDKGLEWYEAFFPDYQEASKYQAIGEISPGYLTYAGCEKRIASVPSIKKIIVILRNPVDRAYSHYGHTIRLSGYSKSFDDFLNDYPLATTMGLYAKHLERYLQYFDVQQLCCFIFEESIENIESTKQKIAHFLDVLPQDFPEYAGLEKINETYIPKFKHLNQLVASVRFQLRNQDIDWIVNLAKQIGFQKILRSGATKLPPLSTEARLKLQDKFALDMDKLEKELNINVNLWRLKNSGGLNL